MRIESRCSDHSPLPVDVQDHLQAAKTLYRFWIDLLNEKFLSPEERISRAGEFFERHFSGTEEEGWLESYDSKYRKPKAVLIKERAYQDWSRVYSGKRHNSPSPWFFPD